MEKKNPRNVFEFNPQDNGGEAVLLITDIIGWDEDGRPIYQQTLELNSYGRAATIVLSDDLSPEKLRKLADELEIFFKIERLKKFEPEPEIFKAK